MVQLLYNNISTYEKTFHMESFVYQFNVSILNVHSTYITNQLL